MEMTQTCNADLLIRAIKSCRNSKVFGPDKLSICHFKNLGPRAIEYITTLFNLSVTTCQIPAIWKSSLIIPMPKPGKDTSQGSSYRSIRESYKLWSCQPSTNIVRLFQTNTVETRTFDHLSSAAVINRHRNGIQPEEASWSYGLRDCRFISCVWHSLS